LDQKKKSRVLIKKRKGEKKNLPGKKQGAIGVHIRPKSARMGSWSAEDHDVMLIKISC